MSRARRSSLRAALALGACAFAALSSTAAQAEGRKVLFVAQAPTPFSARVRAEIAAMGFEIEESAELGPSSARPIAAARVIEGPSRRVELWVADPVTGALTARAVVMPSPEDDEDSQTVRASEQLRAFFQPLAAHLGPAPAPPLLPLPAPVAAPPAQLPPPAAIEPLPVDPPKEIPREEPARPPRFLVGADLAVPFQPGGPGLNLGLRGRWLALEQLGIGAFASVPLLGSTVTAAEGSASLSAALLGVDLGASLRPTPALRLSASAGIALAWLRSSGFASAPYAGRAIDAAFAVPLLGVEIAPRLGGRLSLFLDARIGFSLSRADLLFAGRPVAAWGRPLGMIGTGLSVDL